jgi:peptidoglycan/LPS O-acetylase OafA/YrhL
MMKTMKTQNRMHYIDNIRSLVIIGVVFIHASVTYSGTGNWYYIEKKTVDVVSMLFWIAGYFAASSYSRKGSGRFLSNRTVRLGIPTLIYMLLLHPVIDYVLLGSQSPSSRPPAGPAYARYLLSLEFLGRSGPMWFTFALLIFSVLYALVRTFPTARRNPNKKSQPLSHGILALLAGTISVAAFLIRLVQPIGTDVCNMQLSFFAQYVILFIAGIAAFRHDWVRTLPYRTGMGWFRAALLGGIPFWTVLMLAGGAFGEGFDAFAGGWHWQSAGYAAWESFFGIGVSVGLLVFVREKGDSAGKVANFLSANSFCVYMFHPLVLISVSLLLQPWHGHPVLKVLAAGTLATVIVFLLSHLVLRRVPLLKRVL